MSSPHGGLKVHIIESFRFIVNFYKVYKYELRSLIRIYEIICFTGLSGKQVCARIACKRISKFTARTGLVYNIFH